MKKRLLTRVGLTAALGLAAAGCGGESPDSYASESAAICTIEGGCTSTCTPPQESGQSNYTGSSCTGTEYSENFGGVTRTWDGAGCLGSSAVTGYYYWFRDSTDRCNYWPNGFFSTGAVVRRR